MNPNDSFPVPSPDDPHPKLRCSHSGQILSANAAFLHLLSFDSETELREAVPRVHDLFGDHRDRARLDTGLVEGLTTDEVRWIRSDGTSVWVRVRVDPITSGPAGQKASRLQSGTPSRGTFLHLSVQDVTGRRHLEEQLRQARRMQTLGQLAGGMAHDFNNLLTAILAQLDLLEEGLASDDLDSARKDLSEIRRSVTTGSRMIKQLLSYSRGERIRMAELPLDEVVKDAMRLVRPLVPRGVQVEVETSEVGRVLIDPGALEQILQTLATRAWTSMSDGGRLRIQAARGNFDQRHLLETGWGDPGEYGVLTVEDSGKGMSPATVSRLFQPFFSSSEGEDATALSISMVYGLMKQHRGFIEVESEPEAGTTIRLYFRLAGSPSRRASQVDEFRPEGGETILFVEDDASLRRVAGRVLRSHGFHVLEADHGAEALEVIRKEGKPDLLITDLVMPSMTGIELVDHLEAKGELPPVLMTSGYRPEFLAKGRGRTLDHPFLEKPWTVETLVANVKSILRERGGRTRGVT